MRINQLVLNEFRAYEHKVFSFSPKFNVLIGENGVGKTTVLEGVAVAINSFLSFLVGSSRPIRKEDVRRVSFEHSLEEKLNTYVSAEGYGDNKNIAWTIAKTHRDWGFKKGNDKDLRIWASRCLEELATDGGTQLRLPLFCYLGSGRLWTESTEKVKIFPKGSRLEGYNHCLIAKGHFKRFVEWFKTMELAALQGNEQSKTNARLVREIVSKCLEGWDTILYSVLDDVLMAEKEADGRKVTLPFSYLSDGQRNIIGIVADIAYRCLVLNPHLKEKAIIETQGIVLIDELDLHLHPNWQRSIVSNLKEAFPGLQFIATTHSPFIVQSLGADELINLDKVTDITPKDLSIEEVSENIMGVEANYAEENMATEVIAKEYLTLLENQDFITVSPNVLPQQKLDELESKIADPAIRAFLQMKRLEKESKNQ